MKLTWKLVHIVALPWHPPTIHAISRYAQGKRFGMCWERQGILSPRWCRNWAYHVGTTSGMPVILPPGLTCNPYTECAVSDRSGRSGTPNSFARSKQHMSARQLYGMVGILSWPSSAWFYVWPPFQRSLPGYQIPTTSTLVASTQGGHHCCIKRRPSAAIQYTKFDVKFLVPTNHLMKEVFLF